MRRKQLLEIIESGENLYCEFKLRFSTPEKIAKEMMAFANTKGGILIFGVDDYGQICGVQSEKTESELVKQAVTDYCEPPIDFLLEYFSIEGKELVVVSVPESKIKPHRLQDFQQKIDIRTAKVYVRVNDKSIQASKEMIKLLGHESVGKGLKNYSIGSHEQAILQSLEKKELITVQEVSDLLNISNRRASRTLINLTRIGLLLLHTKENGEENFSLRL